MKARIVIAGGGAGGLELVIALGNLVRRSRLAAEILLIDPSPAHFWKPRLHEVAAGVLDPADQEVSYAALAVRHGFRFVQGSILDMPSEREVRLADNSVVSYDYLVLAVGSMVNDFNTPGVAEYCDMLDSVGQAETLHRHLLASARNSAREPLRVAIIGAGATGVELAAELRQGVETLPEYHALLDGGGLSITIIDMADRVLPAVGPEISRYAARQLAQRNIQLMLGQRVVKVTGDALHLADGQVVPASIKIWASGVKGPEFLKNDRFLKFGPGGRIKVDSALRCEGTENLFAIGDCAAFTQADTGTVLPPTAQAAHQQASFLAKSLPRRLRGRKPGVFRYHYRGTLVSLGKRQAVGEVKGFSNIRLRGAVAKFLYVWLYYDHLAAIYGWPKALRMLAGRRAERLVSQLPVKLHNITPSN